MLKNKICPLCSSWADKIKDDNYFLCPCCRAIFLDSSLYLSPAAEKMRYEEHNNDVYDKRYRRFVSPITSAVLQEQSKSSVGLDFGAGTGPVISVVLEEKGYNIAQYDPFFFNDQSLLKKKFDYIVCCEVAEHFQRPQEEFSLLKKLLKPGGSIYIMTHMYNNKIDFKNWRYRQDPTHIFIYQQETFNYICRKLKFKNLDISGRLIVLRG
jgi:SAM-dependent methyltransferase